MGFYKVITIKIPKIFKQSKNKKYRKTRKSNWIRNKKQLERFLKKAVRISIILIFLFVLIKIVGNLTSRNQDGMVIKTMTGEKFQEPIEPKAKKNIFFREIIPFFNNYNGDDKSNSAEDDENSREYDTTIEYEPITYSNLGMLNSFEDLKKYMYTIDENAYVTEEDLNMKSLLETDVTANIRGGEPKVLIFHTHSQETFADSVSGVSEDTIMGVGQALGEILADTYGVGVVHDVRQYDIKDGKLDRGNSYEVMDASIKKTLEKYPSIEVCIDIHRDGVEEGTRLVTNINGKDTARIMFFNGICRINDNGMPKETEGLTNDYIKENLAFSFNMQAMANTIYPNFTRKIYIKPYRYSLHMKPRSLLVEVGANTNTVSEAKNAMEPLAEILVRVLEGNKKITS